MRAWLTALLLLTLAALPACGSDNAEGEGSLPPAHAQRAPDETATADTEMAADEAAPEEQPAEEQPAEEAAGGEKAQEKTMDEAAAETQPAEEAAAGEEKAEDKAMDEKAGETPPAGEEETAEDTTPVPFGLKWGMQPGELSDLDIKIKDTNRTGDLTVVDSEEVPNAFADTKMVSMLFDRKLGLVKVRWTSTEIEDDPTGTTGRAKYGEMKSQVVSQLGDPSDETLVVGARLFDQEDEFYQCLAYEGCGVWSALWEHQPSGGVLLSVEGTGPGAGYVQVDYESAHWQDAASQAASAAEGESKSN